MRFDKTLGLREAAPPSKCKIIVPGNNKSVKDGQELEPQIDYRKPYRDFRKKR